MALTVRDIVDMEQFACSVTAGSSGLDRPVLWAHSCELEDPWTWLGQDELLMTVGICVPSESWRQVRFIDNLQAAGLVGIAIGDHRKAPPLTMDMLARADELSFPMLSVRYTTPFAALARAVAVASQSEHVARISRLSRLYELARMTTPGGTELLERLSAEIGYPLHVIDVDYRTEVLPAATALDAELITALSDQVSSPERLPTRLSARTTAGAATAFALSTHRHCLMVMDGCTDVDLDVFVVLHAQSLIGVEVERVTRERERNDYAGGQLLVQLIDGALSGDAALPRLEQAGLVSAADWHVVAYPASALDASRAVLADIGIAHVSCVHGHVAVLLCDHRDTDSVVAALKPHIEPIGTSAAVRGVSRISDSAREARWALEAARSKGTDVASYTTAVPLFLPRTIGEARFAATTVLGPLLEQDRTHGNDLVATLRAFLAQERSWSSTARELRIHRQTLGYRLRKIEALTDRSTRRPADIALFWMALAALDIAGEA